jgi:hypothetical protein
VIGIETSILYEGFSDLKTDRRYYYTMNQEIAALAPAQYVIFNFASSENLNLILEQTKNIVMPHFKKNMAASGMMGWGLGLKVTPQGTDYASMMTYNAYGNLENVIKHLSGGAAISSSPQNKLNPIQWSMRPVMQVMGATTSKP